jgi:uncharacterized protein
MSFWLFRNHYFYKEFFGANLSGAMKPREKKTLVIGASLKPDRFSNKAVRRLAECGFPVVAVGRREGDISGTPVSTPFPEIRDIHTVTLYVGPANQPFWYDFILSANPQRVIFNPGTYNEELVQKLREKNVEIVEDCTLIMLSAEDF